jgi:glucose/arabinose dehydrogenase
MATVTSSPTATVSEPEPTMTPVPTEAATIANDTLAPEPTAEAAAPIPTDTPEPAPTPAPPPTDTPNPVAVALEAIRINLAPVASGFTKPVFLTHAGDGSGRLFVVEQAGRIFILRDGAVLPTPFLDIVAIVGSDSPEQGLLSAAFHPDYPNNGFFFVNYTDRQGDTVIARYQVSANSDVADPDSANVLMTIGQPYPNHNGGQVVFGPDGYLYVGMGDGGAANDPQNNGQTLSTLLGDILRIDVDHAEPYGVPDNNPFVNVDGARPEIWSYGWRNPWRIAFDPVTQDMYIGDVGQNEYEEISVELAGTPGGQNYGWRLLEGRHCFNPRECDPASLGVVLPIAEYDHGQGCSVTGGYVYRGARFPELAGIYFYGDYCSGTIWGLRHEPDGRWSELELLRTDVSISSFGQDAAGEVYVVNHQGNIFQIVRE